MKLPPQRIQLAPEAAQHHAGDFKKWLAGPFPVPVV